MTAEIIYKGSLHCQATHVKSQTIIETDAPIDNKGKGAKFSPSDLLAAALGSCIITTIGIKTDTWEKSLDGTRLEVTKVMSLAPRRVAELTVEVYLPDGSKFDEKERQILENIAKTCPVAASLHPDLQQKISFHW